MRIRSWWPGRSANGVGDGVGDGVDDGIGVVVGFGVGNGVRLGVCGDTPLVVLILKATPRLFVK